MLTAAPEKLAEIVPQLEALKPQAMPELAAAYGDVFLVSTVLVAVVLVPAFFLPRHKPAQPVDPTILAGH